MKKPPQGFPTEAQDSNPGSRSRVRSSTCVPLRPTNAAVFQIYFDHIFLSVCAITVMEVTSVRTNGILLHVFSNNFL